MRAPVRVLVAAIVLAGTCEAGLLGITESQTRSSRTAPGRDGGGARAAAEEAPPRAQGGQGRLAQQQAGLAGDNAPFGRPNLAAGPGVARYGAAPAGGSMTGGSPAAGGALARGPVTGLSKRQMAWRKRAPTPQGKDRAASEISAAVGELEGLQLDIADRKYMNDVLQVTKEAKANSEAVQDEKKLNGTLSAFGRKQRAIDLTRGVAGRYRTRRPTPSPSGLARNSTVFAPSAAFRVAQFGRASAAAQAPLSEDRSRKQELMRRAFAPSSAPSSGPSSVNPTAVEARKAEANPVAPPFGRGEARRGEEVKQGGREGPVREAAPQDWRAAAAAPTGSQGARSRESAGKLEDAPGASLVRGDMQSGQARASSSDISQPRPQIEEAKPSMAAPAGEARGSGSGARNTQGQESKEKERPGAKQSSAERTATALSDGVAKPAAPDALDSQRSSVRSSSFADAAKPAASSARETPGDDTSTSGQQSASSVRPVPDGTRAQDGSTQSQDSSSRVAAPKAEGSSDSTGLSKPAGTSGTSSRAMGASERGMGVSERPDGRGGAGRSSARGASERADRADRPAAYAAPGN